MEAGRQENPPKPREDGLCREAARWAPELNWDRSAGGALGKVRLR
jgi:hypothetical protein